MNILPSPIKSQHFLSLAILICKLCSGPSSAFEKWSGQVEPKGSRMGV